MIQFYILKLLNISKIIEQNNKTIKIILVKENNIENNKSELIDFIEKNKIPIYKLKNITKYNDFIYYFLNNKNLDYINISTFMKNDNTNNNNYKNDENKYKNMNIIHKFNNIYKFDFYLDIKKNNDNNYNEIINEIENKYKIINIKIIKRLICEIIASESIKLSDIKSNIEEVKHIVYIYEVLCMEYYFNNSVNIFDEILKKDLRKYLLKLLKNNEWLKLYLDQDELEMLFKYCLDRNLLLVLIESCDSGEILLDEQRVIIDSQKCVIFQNFDNGDEL